MKDIMFKSNAKQYKNAHTQGSDFHAAAVGWEPVTVDIRSLTNPGRMALILPRLAVLVADYTQFVANPGNQWSQNTHPVALVSLLSYSQNVWTTEVRPRLLHG